MPFSLAALLLAWLAILATDALAIEIREVTSPKGIQFWMVEDYTVPIITMSFEFEGGATQDPEGKEGLASILSAMMDEGAGEFSTAELKASIEALGAEIGFSSGRDALSGGLRVFAPDAAPAFDLLRTMLMEPRFEEASLERIRASLLRSALAARSNPRNLFADSLRELVFVDHPYARDTRGTVDSLEAITREDIVSMHANMLARETLKIGVVGALNADEASRLIDLAFADLPKDAQITVAPDIEPRTGFNEFIEFAAPQTTIAVVLPGVLRKDEDFFTAYIMNHILGGGTFSSRLFDEVREKRGLVYGINSSLNTLRHSAYISAGFSTLPEQADEALAIVLGEIERMANEGPTAQELELAKRFIYGAYAINNLDTSSSIADVLVTLQAEDLPIDYIDQRREAIFGVTLEDIRRVAADLLGAEPGILMLGPQLTPKNASANDG